MHFTLERRTNKRNRGMRIVAECAYVVISNTTIVDGNPLDANNVAACIDLRGEDERYSLIIPPEKLQSVIDRLETCKQQIAKQQELQYKRLAQELD